MPERNNKIVLIAEKPEKFVEKSPKEEDPIDANNFSILKEISDFETKITELENNNKKFNENKKQTLKIKEEIENSSNKVKENNNSFDLKENNRKESNFNLLGREAEIKEKRKFNIEEDFESNPYIDIVEKKKEYNEKSRYDNSDKKKRNILEEEYEVNDFKVVKEKDYKEELFNKGKENILKQYNNNNSKNDGLAKKQNDKDFKGSNGNKPRSLLDKTPKKSNNNVGYDFDINRQKNVDKELDLSFLPKELIYSEKSYGESKNNLLAAIEILEKAQDNRNQVQRPEKPQESKSFWSFMNNFKCGHNN